MNFFDCIIVFSVYSNFKKEPNLQTIDKNNGKKLRPHSWSGAVLNGETA